MDLGIAMPDSLPPPRRAAPYDLVDNKIEKKKKKEKEYMRGYYRN